MTRATRIPATVPIFAMDSIHPTSPASAEDNRFVDLHADTPMHGLALNSESMDAGLLMKIWMGLTRLGSPHYCRQVTCECLKRRMGGAQVFSVTTEGFPPFWRLSHRFYTQAVAHRPRHANDTRFNTLIDQIAWVQREAGLNPEILAFSGLPAQTANAVDPVKVRAFIGIEGASVLFPRRGDAKALDKFLAESGNGIPRNMLLPTEAELASTAGRVDYLARSGVLYVGLNHINSSEFSGSDFILAAKRGSGLSDEGRLLVKLLNGAGILVDAAHASRNAQRDLVGLCTLPLIVSHGLLPRSEDDKLGWRDTDPALLDEIRRTGGVFGVMFATNYLDKDAVTHIVDQIDFIKRRIGVDYAAFGSDADGFVGMAVEKLDVTPIIEEMRRRGYTEEELAKVRCGNFARVLRMTERW